MAVRVPTERLREFRTGLLAIFRDFGKAFDSVNRDVLCSIRNLVNLTSSLFSGTEGAVKWHHFRLPVDTGVRKGRVPAPTQHLHGACTEEN